MTILKTKKLFKNAIRTVLKENGTNEVLSEAALPAYAHKNLIIDFIFWQRIQVALKNVLNSGGQLKNVLDFGCGTGVLSYELANAGYQVTALDLDLSPKNRLAKLIDFPKQINFIEENILNHKFDEKFDVILALDVLEHIPLDVLPIYLNYFEKILSQKGKIIISGPTENILYKIGRFMAGSDFTGSYHETNITSIKKEFNLIFNVKVLKKLYFPFVLFEIFEATKK